MRFPSLKQLIEVRRLLPVLAAVLFVGALWFPMWRIDVHAVQYPDTVLHIELFAYPHVAGDYVEMARLNQYIGFYYPDPVYWEPNYEVHENAVQVPEWSLGPLAFVGCALAGVFVALAPTERKLRKGLLVQVLATIGVFTVMVADIQYRLYQTGHELDPNAPVMGVDGFTPPLVGQYEVANITSYSSFGLGAYMSILAVALLVVAYRYRDTVATPRDLVVGLAGVRPLRAIRERLPGRDDGSEDENPADPTGDHENPPDPTGDHEDRGGPGSVGGD